MRRGEERDLEKRTEGAGCGQKKTGRVRGKKKRSVYLKKTWSEKKKRSLCRQAATPHLGQKEKKKKKGGKGKKNMLAGRRKGREGERSPPFMPTIRGTGGRDKVGFQEGKERRGGKE